LSLKTALCHDWLNGMRGGEKCLEVLCEIFPEAPVHALFYEKGKVSSVIGGHPIKTSFVQRLPGVFGRYRFYLPLFPSAAESFDLRGYDLVISTSHCVAKGVRKPESATHICYCFTPVRYAWGFFDEYFGRQGFVGRAVIGHFIDRLRRWDRAASSRVDHFVAISRHVAERVRRCYGREAEVVYPPVDVRFYTPGENGKRGDFYLVVSALVPYKRVDLAIETFNRSGRKLVVIGDGPEKARLRALAGPGVRFLGWQSDEALKEYYRSARALVFPGEEDFGIVPVEAQACGLSVVAFGRGGALETVDPGKTGVFFDDATPESLEDAIQRLEVLNLLPEDARANALRFGRDRFKSEMLALIEKKTGRKL